jgi:hypothetical protein
MKQAIMLLAVVCITAFNNLFVQYTMNKISNNKYERV